MKYTELREKIQNSPKYEGCRRIERSPLIHAGFPGTFNLSFTEHPWLSQYGRYVDFNHDYIFSAVQSCIRFNDFDFMQGDKAWKYLGVFEMADLSGAIGLKNKFTDDAVHRKQIFDLVSFLGELGFSPEKVYPSYCGGGKVAELTNGKYSFDYEVVEDQVSKIAFLESGVPERNLTQDKSRDTFLSINLKKEEQGRGISLAYSSWGYRNEVNLSIYEGRLLDIGTLERFAWTPRWEGEEIIGLNDTCCGFSIAAFGLERLCMAANGLERVQDIDYIKPFYDEMKKHGAEDSLSGESLRALHRIYSDMVKFSIRDLGRHRRSKIKKILDNIPLGIKEEQLRDLLLVHSETQPWHKELKDGIELTLERIKSYRKAKKIG